MIQMRTNLEVADNSGDDTLQSVPLICVLYAIEHFAEENASLRRPERKAVVEPGRVLVHELQRPGRAAVDGLVDP